MQSETPHNPPGVDRALIDLCELTSDFIGVTNAEGRLLHLNPAAREVSGLPDGDELSDHSVLELYPQHHHDLLSEARRTAAEEGIWSGEISVLKCDGSELQVLQVTVVNRDAEGRISGFTSVLRDVAGLTELHSVLRESEERFRTLADASPVGVYRLDRSARHVYANAQWYELSGLGELPLGEAWGAAVHPEDRERVWQAGLDAMKRRATFSMRHRALRPDGSVRTVASDAVPLFEGDRFEGWVGTVQDVTEQEDAQARADRMVAILEATPDVAGIADARGHLQYLNRAGREFYGIGPDEDLEVVEARQLVAPDALLPLEQEAEGARDTGDGFSLETVLLDNQGRRVPVSLVGVVHRDEQGEAEFISTIARDISSLKDAEQRLAAREAWFRSLALHAGDMVVVLDANRDRKYLSPSVKETLGWDDDDLKQGAVSEILDPDDLDRYQGLLTDLLDEPGRTVETDIRIRDRSGDWREIEAMITNLLDDPSVLGIVHNLRDVTERKQAERAQRRTDAALRALVSHAPVAIHLLDSDGTIRFWSATSESMLGWTADDVVGNTGPPPFVPEDEREVRGERNQRVFEGESVNADTRRLCKDGSLLDVSVNASPLRDSDGTITGVISVTIDITARKRAEDALRDSELRFRTLVQSSADMTLVLDADGLVSYASPSTLEFLGRTAEQVVGHEFGDGPMHAGDVPRVRAVAQRLMSQPGASVSVDFRSRRADGSWRWLETVVSNQLDNPAVRGIVTNSFDVTERVEALETLRSINARLERTNETLGAIVNDSPLALAVVSRRGIVEVWNPAAADLFGWSAEEVEGGPDRTAPVELDDDDEISTAILNGRNVTNEETRRRHKDGHLIDVMLSAAPVRSDADEVTSVIVLAADITERKRAEEALRASDERFRSLVRNASDVISIIDAEGIVTFTTANTEDMLGYSMDEMVGLNIFDIVHPDGLDRGQGLLTQRVDDGGHGFPTEHRVRRADGTWCDVETIAVNLLDDPAIGGIVLTTRDIGERKEAEEKLRRSEERFKALVQNTSDAIAVIAPDGPLLYASPSARDIIGSAKTGDDLFNQIHPDDADAVFAEFAVLHGGGEFHPIEYRVRRDDGTWRTIETMADDLQEDPAVGGLVVTSRDVSARKEAEEELRRSEERFRALVQNTSDAIVVVGADGELTYVSPSARDVVGDATNGYETMERIHPDDVERVMAEFAVLLDGGEFRALQYRVRSAAGGWRVVETMADNLLDDPAVGGLVITTRDITDREEAEEALRESEARYRAIVEDQTELICRWTEEGTITFANLAYARAMGFMPDELVGRSVFDLVPGDTKFSVRRRMQQTATGRATVEELPLDPGDGQRRWVHWTLRAISDHTADEDRHEYQVVGLDVTERRQAERLAEEQSSILEMVARGADQTQVFDELCHMLESHVRDTLAAVVLFDSKEGVVTRMAAPSLPADYVAWVEQEVGGAVTPDMQRLLDRTDDVDVERLSSTVTPDLTRHAAAAGIKGAWVTPVNASVRDEVLGVVVCNQNEQKVPSDADRRVAQTVASLVGIAVERARAEAELSHQALHDPLTGLPNRALFLDRLQQSLARSRRSHTSCAVLFLDLDRFKTINDSLGHDTGDELLVAVARRLEAALRPGDTVARFGGDEFTVLCDDLADPHLEPREIADRLLDAIIRPFPLRGEEEAYLTASIGIALASGVDDRPQTLLRDADAAMYRAKEEGKARHVVFDDAMRATAVERLETETALHRALDRGEFEVFYQPVISLNDARCAGAEALVRWRHPERGLVAPAEFINLAEETGLIVSLGAWVLEEACRQAAVWQSRAAADDPFTVAVNLSARQLSNPTLVDQVRGALHRTGVDPAHIALEITEDVLMDDTDATMRTLSDLKGLGVNLGIDDFGTGYSSLGYLKRLPVGLVKIDRSFVAGLGRDPEDSAIVTAVISLADALDMEVVAEGVESSEQLAELLALGCDYAQGFFFSPPQPADDLEALVGSKRTWRPPGSSLMESVDYLAAARRRRAGLRS